MNSFENSIEIGDLHVEPLAKMKKKHERKVEFGRCILGSQSERNHTKTKRHLMISMFTFCYDFD